MALSYIDMHVNCRPLTPSTQRDATAHQQRPAHTCHHYGAPPWLSCFSINFKWLSVTLADKAETKMTYMPWMEELKPNIITRLCMRGNHSLSLRLTFWFPTFLAQLERERGRDRWRLISLLSEEILKWLFKGIPHTFNPLHKSTHFKNKHVHQLTIDLIPFRKKVRLRVSVSSTSQSGWLFSEQVESTSVFISLINHLCCQSSSRE